MTTTNDYFFAGTFSSTPPGVGTGGPQPFALPPVSWWPTYALVPGAVISGHGVRPHPQYGNPTVAVALPEQNWACDTCGQTLRLHPQLLLFQYGGEVDRPCCRKCQTHMRWLPEVK